LTKAKRKEREIAKENSRLFTVVHVFTRVFRIFYCAKSIDWAVSARARNWCNNAITYGQTAAKKRVARNDQTAEVRRRGDQAKNDVWTRAYFVASTTRLFFYILIGCILEPLNDVIEKFNELIDIILVTYTY